MEKDLMNMSEKEIAALMLDYIDRTDSLLKQISEYLERKPTRQSREDILLEYKRLKEEIKEDAHYVDLRRNKQSNSAVYSHIFIPSIIEASASGFTSSTNSRVDQKLYSSVAMARYGLTKYHERSRWLDLLNT